MSSDFDWQIGSESEWITPPPPTEPRPPQRRARWRRFLPLLVLVAWVPLYLTWRNYAANTETAVRADILTAHTTLWQANQRGDSELFHTLRLNTPSQSWTWQVDALFADGDFLNRPQLGLSLWHQPPAVITLTVAPTLDKALLTVSQQYETAVGEPITLQQAYAYQQQAESWLLAPLDNSFWGDWQQAAGPWLTADFTTHDAAISGRLTADLNSLIEQLCQDATFTCLSDLQLELSLRPEYDSLTPEATYDDPARLSLPTPSLLGLPADEAGYRALWRYYGRQVSDRLWQLRPAPNSLSLFDNERLAQAAWQRLLVQQNLIVWPTPERPAPPTWPSATLAVLCLDEDNSLAWWHYLPQTAEWVTALTLRQVTAVRPLAESALLIQEKNGNQSIWQIIWPDGTKHILATAAFASPDLRPVTNGRQVRLTTPETASALLLDVNACHQNSCDWQVSPETAVISPNGQQQIRVNGLGLIRSNSTGTEAEANFDGFAPFWLQDEIYGYLRPRPGQPGTIEVVAATTRNDKPYRLFTSQDLQALLPTQTESLLINSIALSTSDFTRLTILATAPEQNQTFTFSFYRITGEIALVTVAEPLADQGQSPDGRWTIHLQDASLTLRDLNTNTTYGVTPPNAACAYTAWVE